MASFRLTTKVQVSGWRFLLRRVEHAIVPQGYPDVRRPAAVLQPGGVGRNHHCGADLPRRGPAGVLQAARKARQRHPSRRPHDQSALCGDAGYRAAAAGVQPDLGTAGARQRGHPGRGEVRRVEQDAQGPAHRHSRRALCHAGCGRRRIDVDVVRHRHQAGKCRSDRGDVGDRAPTGDRSVGGSPAAGPGHAGVLRREQLAGHR